jgi:hypothetical protein
MAATKCPHCQSTLPDVGGTDRAQLDKCPACHLPLELPTVRPTVRPSAPTAFITAAAPETGRTLRQGVMAVGLVSVVTAVIVLCIVIARPSKSGPKASAQRPITAEGLNPKPVPVTNQIPTPALVEQPEPLRERREDRTQPTGLDRLMDDLVVKPSVPASSKAGSRRPKVDPEADPAPAPDPLASLVKDLNAQKSDQRVQAADAIRRLGTDGKPAARALCKAIAAHEGRSRLACLDALKAVFPELHRPIETLAIEGNFPRHREAVHELTVMGTLAAPAIPVVVTYHQRLPTMLMALSGVGGKSSAGTIESMLRTAGVAMVSVHSFYDNMDLALLRAMAAIGPDDLETRPAFMLALSPVILPQARTPQVHPKHSTAVRLEVIEGLTRMAEHHPDLGAQTVRELRKLLTDSALTMTVIKTLPRLGAPAKDALADLRKFRMSNVRELRDAAAEAIEAIEAAK